MRKDSATFNRIKTLMLLALVILGLLVAAAPAFGKAWDRHEQSQRTRAYVSASNNPEVAARFSAATRYNQEFPGPTHSTYPEVLGLPNTDAVGRLEVSSVGIDLPIYAGATDEVLEKGVGHVPYTHLPVGGKGTHSVLSAHTGLHFSTMFDDLPEVQVGDLIILEVLGRDLAYKVTNTQVLLPEEAEREVSAPSDGDLLSLLTCTPYGVNTHRLLVTGERTDDLVYKVDLVQRPSTTLAFGVFAVVTGFGTIALATALLRNPRAPKSAMRKVLDKTL